MKIWQNATLSITPRKRKYFIVLLGTIFLLSMNMCDRGRMITHRKISRFHTEVWYDNNKHYNNVIMGAMASEITSLTIVYSTDFFWQRSKKHQSSASPAFVRGIHQWAVYSLHKGPVTRKMFPFDDVIMVWVTFPYRRGTGIGMSSHLKAPKDIIIF